MKRKKSNIASNRFSVSKEQIKVLSKKGYSHITQDNLKLYIKRFHVFKKSLDCEIIINASTGDLEIDVTNNQVGLPYAPFYRQDSKKYNVVVQKINQVVAKELEQIGAVAA